MGVMCLIFEMFWCYSGCFQKIGVSVEQTKGVSVEQVLVVYRSNESVCKIAGVGCG